ncbi:OmpA family protein [Geomonas sp. RF6]|uniref:OmpA family protein n=1 Tax=Geomonas sp. RF6 TaxID=2897342 RepID=UPI001E31CE43|nr:OmpA family protein [Geomonas sp. RF6]UFS69401.1 OmpA family protein [Geomonas sp. RF6]
MKANIVVKFIAVFSTAAFLATGCATDQQGQGGEFGYKKTTIGAVSGGAIGAGIGALAGGKSHRGRNAAIGGLSGAVVGGAVGLYMDKQAAKLKQQMPEAEVVRDGDKVYVALPSGILFDLGKDALKPAARDSLAKAATTLRTSETNIIIEGHTDSTGNNSINQPLSERRARNVMNFLASNGVPASRMTAVGYGSSRPAVPNDTEANRALNRRVQLEISPNERLKAQEGKGTGTGNN